MERINDLVKRKREIFHYYRNHLADCREITMNPEPEGTVNGYWMPTVVYDSATWV